MMQTQYRQSLMVTLRLLKSSETHTLTQNYWRHSTDKNTKRNIDKDIEKSFAETFDLLLKSVYGWSVKDGKCVPPKIIFPKQVADRIEYFSEEMENGLTLQGALEYIFARGEKKCKEDCEQFMDWLPVSDEFKKWSDDYFSYNYKEAQVMLALIYGNYQVEEDE